MAWQEFLRGKRKRKDVAKFSVRLLDNILELHRELRDKTYEHGSYYAFKINDPKPRSIHKASIRDRLLLHAIYRILYPYFDSKFIFDSFSCRHGKGTHRSINRFREYVYKVSKNHTQTTWILKCDIKRFFDNIDHKVLKEILKNKIKDNDVIWLLEKVIDSFHTEDKEEVGLPLGNLTSQLLVNIYMNDFDQFLKRDLKVRYYVRYADDFIILDTDRYYLENILSKIALFLKLKLKLSLHPKKISIKTLSSGIDFLGWVHFPDHRVLRTVTKKRMFRNINLKKGRNETVQSYLGLLSHGNTKKLQREVKNMIEY